MEGLCEMLLLRSIIFKNDLYFGSPSRLGGVLLGKVRTDTVKRISRKILEEYPDRFTTDFEKNKVIFTEELKIDVKTKRLRNRIVGYITHLVKVRGEDVIVVREGQ
ncbi:MAG: 30S ribosomal protein S17e [Candidatus Ranarchaeia archaeon]